MFVNKIKQYYAAAGENSFRVWHKAGTSRTASVVSITYVVTSAESWGESADSLWRPVNSGSSPRQAESGSMAGTLHRAHFPRRTDDSDGFTPGLTFW